MKLSQKLGILALTAICATATGAAVAAPSGPRHSPAEGNAAVVAPVDRATESKFIPIAPCRLVDTRHGGGPLVGYQVRSFYATGTSEFTTQGGTNGGCGIPTAATAIDVIVQSLNSAGRGYLSETPYGTAFSDTGLLHYINGQTISSGATLPIDGTAARAFSLEAFSAKGTDVVIDVVGYFVKPMLATVDKTGKLLFGSRVVSVAGSAGAYDIRFDRSLAACNYQATPFTASTAIVVTAGLVTGTTNTILVKTTVNGAATAATFYLSVSC